MNREPDPRTGAGGRFLVFFAVTLKDPSPDPNQNGGVRALKQTRVLGPRSQPFRFEGHPKTLRHPTLSVGPTADRRMDQFQKPIGLDSVRARILIHMSDV